MRSRWLRGSIYWVLLVSGRFSVIKPLSQIQRSTSFPIRPVATRPLSVDSGLQITVILAEILLGDGAGGGLPDASFGAGLSPTDTSTGSLPNTEVFLGNHDASPLDLVAVGTQPAGLGSFFLANTDAEFSPEFTFRNPFLQGQLRGLTHLEGRTDSWGIMVQVGEVAHRVERDGRFNLLLPEGTHDISIWAPGYIAVNLPNVEIKSGQVLTVPELTLPFGDANGDGRIDILDLSIAAGNFGATVQELELP